MLSIRSYVKKGAWRWNLMLASTFLTPKMHVWKPLQFRRLLHHVIQDPCPLLTEIKTPKVNPPCEKLLVFFKQIKHFFYLKTPPGMKDAIIVRQFWILLKKRMVYSWPGHLVTFYRGAFTLPGKEKDFGTFFASVVRYYAQDTHKIGLRTWASTRLANLRFDFNWSNLIVPLLEANHRTACNGIAFDKIFFKFWRRHGDEDFAVSSVHR